MQTNLCTRLICRNRRAVPVLILSLTVLLASCRDPQVVTYKAPKETTTTATTPNMSSAQLASDTPPPVRWQTPGAWKTQTAAAGAVASVRVGSFLVSTPDGKTADMAITTFPGDVGGDLANVNRWRSQLSLAPISNAQLPGAIKTITVSAGEFQLIDITSESTPAKRTLGAWIKQPGEDRTWFFKMTGDADLVGAQRDTFLAFLNTVAFTH